MLQRHFQSSAGQRGLLKWPRDAPEGLLWACEGVTVSTPQRRLKTRSVCV